MRYSLLRWFKKIFSSYSEKTMHLYKIFLFKIDVYLLNRRKNKSFKQIGKIFYIELLKHKEIDQILETIQPILSLIDKIDKKIDDIHLKIFKIATNENIPKEEVEKIDQFILNADIRSKDPIFDENEELDDDEIDDLTENDLSLSDNIEKDLNDQTMLTKDSFTKNRKKKTKKLKSKK